MFPSCLSVTVEVLSVPIPFNLVVSFSVAESILRKLLRAVADFPFFVQEFAIVSSQRPRSVRPFATFSEEFREVTAGSVSTVIVYSNISTIVRVKVPSFYT